MQINKIKRALRGKQLTIFADDGGFQWLSDGRAAYLMDRELDLTRANLLAIMDIEEDKRDSYRVIEDGTAPAWLDQCPQEDADEDLTPGGEVVNAFLMGPIEKATGYGYISHFATCEKAEEFRGGGHV